VSVPHSYGSLIMDQLPETCRLSMDVEILADTAQLGVALQVDEEFSQGYYVIVDPWRRRVEYKTSVRMTERGGQKFPYEVEMERPLSPFTGNTFHMDVLVDGSILVVYIDNRIALGTRMFDRQGDSFGLFVSEGHARFTNVKLFSE
jgi:beta-fructofuranosidase